jgi:esterase
MHDTTRKPARSDESALDRRELLRSLTSYMAAALATAVAPAGLWAAAPPTQSTAGSGFRKVNGVRLHFLEWGTAGARPLVLLHPAPLNAHVWEDFARTMAPHFHVVAPDARGFGDSDWSPPDTYGSGVFMQDLHALTRELGLRRFVLCGNSMGGSIAIGYASTYPEMVERLIVVDTGPGPKPIDARARSSPPSPASAPPPRPRPAGPVPVPPGPFASPEDALARVNAALGAAFAAVGVKWEERFARAFVHENLKQVATGAWQWKYDYEGHKTAGGFERSQADPRRWPRWRSIKCPTLVLRGAQSPALSQAAAEEMVHENPNARLVVIPEAGHFIELEQPAAFERAVREWLGV